MKLLLIGGAGAQAQFAIEKLNQDDYFDEVILADYNEDRVKKIVDELANPKFRAEYVDVFETEELVKIMNKVEVVANASGPYYRLLPPIMDALFKSNCKKYVDFCDDLEVLDKYSSEEFNQKAKENDMQIVLGLGASPGMFSVVSMYGASLMDEVDRIDINLMMDESDEGGIAVWDHMFENFTGDITILKDGEYQTEEGFTIAYPYEFDTDVFPNIGEVTLYTLGHPEVYTLPKGLPDIQNIKIRCTYYPLDVQEQLVSLNRLGLLNEKLIEVDGQEVSPRKVLLEKMSDTVLNDDIPGGFNPDPRIEGESLTGATIEIYGSLDGEPALFEFTNNVAMGPMTGFPLAVGAKYLAEGRIKDAGAMVVENAITDRRDFISDVLNSIKKAGYHAEYKTILKKNIQL